MKVDKATMAHALEARTPFLDYRVVEFALNIPARYKIRCLKGKYILRRIASRYLPAAIAWRKKHGFVVPTHRWLAQNKGALAERTLEGPSLKEGGIFQRQALERLFGRVRQGESEESHLLWNMMILCLWLDGFKRLK